MRKFIRFVFELVAFEILLRHTPSKSLSELVKTVAFVIVILDVREWLR